MRPSARHPSRARDGRSRQRRLIRGRATGRIIDTSPRSRVTGRGADGFTPRLERDIADDCSRAGTRGVAPYAPTRCQGGSAHGVTRFAEVDLDRRPHVRFGLDQLCVVRRVHPAPGHLGVPDRGPQRPHEPRGADRLRPCRLLLDGVQRRARTQRNAADQPRQSRPWSRSTRRTRAGGSPGAS